MMIPHCIRSIIFPIGIYLAGMLGSAVNAQPQTVAKKPNIIVILADDLGIGDISCYGATMVKTPNIDELAAEGMRFTQAYTAGSVCSPTRYALLTGTYPCRGPIKGKAVADGGINARSPLSIDTASITLPRLLKQQGYRTAHIGKWHLGYGEDGIKNWAGEIKPGPLEIGFDYTLGVVTNHNDQCKTYLENHRLKWLKDSITQLDEKPELEHLTDYRRDDEVDSTLTRKACEFIRQNKTRPFFIYLALVATHTHITPAAPFRGTSEAGQLGDYIHELDSHVGEIKAQLDKLGLAKNTLLIFTSDNGGQSDDARGAGINLRVRDDSHDVIKKARTAKNDARKLGHKTNLDLNGYKGGINEGGFRVPFIACWPGVIPSGTTCSEVISLTDLLATTAGIIGAELPKSAGGDSFDQSPVLLGKTIEQPIRTTTVLQASNGRLALRQGDWKYFSNEQPSWDGNTVRLSRERLELYNLAEDPYEANNLAQTHPERVTSMQNLLEEIVNSGQTHGVVP